MDSTAGTQAIQERVTLGHTRQLGSGTERCISGKQDSAQWAGLQVANGQITGSRTVLEGDGVVNWADDVNSNNKLAVKTLPSNPFSPWHRSDP